MKRMNRAWIASCALGVAMSFASIGCGGSSSEDASGQSQQALGTMPASASTKASLGIDAWQFSLAANGEVVVQGLGANATIVADVHVQSIAGSAGATVHVIKDANGALQVTADGQVVVNTLPAATQSLVLALKVDIDLSLIANALQPGCFLVSAQYATAVAATVSACIDAPALHLCLNAAASVTVPDAQLHATCGIAAP